MDPKTKVTIFPIVPKSCQIVILKLRYVPNRDFYIPLHPYYVGSSLGFGTGLTCTEELSLWEDMSIFGSLLAVVRCSLLSACLFLRSLSQLIRSCTTVEEVEWAQDVQSLRHEIQPRVGKPRNNTRWITPPSPTLSLLKIPYSHPPTLSLPPYFLSVSKRL